MEQTSPYSRPQPLTFETASSEETRRLASALSPVLLPGDVVVLAGDLGAGKTTFVQGLAAGLGITEQVTSPSFILMKEYSGGRFPLMHLDVYRLERIQEVIDLGYDEFLDPSHIVAVEWGDVVEPLLPSQHLMVQLLHLGEDRRRVVMTARGVPWRERMAKVAELSNELLLNPGGNQTQC